MNITLYENIAYNRHIRFFYQGSPSNYVVSGISCFDLLLFLIPTESMLHMYKFHPPLPKLKPTFGYYNQKACEDSPTVGFQYKQEGIWTPRK